MPNENQQLKDQIDALKLKVEGLESAFYLGNFASSQDFNKYCRFNSRLKVPSYSVAPASCEVGEIIEVAGELAICATADTFVVVGTQT